MTSKGISRAAASVASSVKSTKLVSRRVFHNQPQESPTNAPPGQNRRDLILSVLEAQPSARDSRTYLKAFAPQQQSNSNSSTNSSGASDNTSNNAILQRGTSSGFLPQMDTFMPTTAYPGPRGGRPPSTPSANSTSAVEDDPAAAVVAANISDSARELIASMLTPDHSHTALVKVQGPFTDRQLKSIAEGLVYLGRLGLFSIIVVDSEDWYENKDTGHDLRTNGISRFRQTVQHEAIRLSTLLEKLGCPSRPLTDGIFVSNKNNNNDDKNDQECKLNNIDVLRSAIEQGETPVIAPIAIDSQINANPVRANDAIEALASALCHPPPDKRPPSPTPPPELDHNHNHQNKNVREEKVDLVPVRIMLINREGGIPSHARRGDPHLSINLQAEYDEIQNSFIWSNTHPTALSNLKCLRNCLAIMPRSSSAVIVSHRSNRSLIANLITNKPAHSPSLRHSFLAPTTSSNLTHTPTVVRHGLPIRVLRSFDDINQDKLTNLLELAFYKTLNSKSYYDRLKDTLEFAIVAGDYQAVAIVTNETMASVGLSSSSSSSSSSQEQENEPIAYLDKFAVLPSLHGDGTVDFLWGALRDESFGLGLIDALNSNGGRGGSGVGRDLVWRSRADNPVNKWYFERSNGFAKISMGRGGAPGLMFWCDAEVLAPFEEDEDHRPPPPPGPSSTKQDSCSKQLYWSNVISQIPSCWSK